MYEHAKTADESASETRLPLLARIENATVENHCVAPRNKKAPKRKQSVAAGAFIVNAGAFTVAASAFIVGAGALGVGAHASMHAANAWLPYRTKQSKVMKPSPRREGGTFSTALCASTAQYPSTRPNPAARPTPDWPLLVSISHALASCSCS